MTFSAVPDILMVSAAKVFMTHFGYPEYFIPFIGVAKLMGSIAILIPAFKKIKEWAYAGLFFDLVGATYSNVMTDGVHPSIAMMFILLAVATTSYLYNQKYFSKSAAA